MDYFPIFLDIKSKRCIVVGGGAVAERKTASLLKSGADVILFGTAPTAENIALDAGWNLVGFRSLDTGTMRDAVIPAEVTRVIMPDGTGLLGTREMEWNDTFAPGAGYWMYSTSATMMSLP